MGGETKSIMVLCCSENCFGKKKERWPLSNHVVEKAVIGITVTQPRIITCLTNIITCLIYKFSQA